MGAKRTILERLAAGLLALVLIFGIVASADLAGLVPQVEAAEQAEYPDYHVYNRLRKDGLYTIHPSFDLGLALDITMDSVGTQYANTVLDDAKADPSQRFVIQLDEKKSPSLYGGANVSAYVPAAAPIINEDGTVTRDPNSGVYESQHFVIQKISGGFYSILSTASWCWTSAAPMPSPVPS